MDDYQKAADYLAKRIGDKARTAIILGSGLGALAEQIAATTTIPYAEIPHFVRSTAAGHQGNLLCGQLAGKPVVAMQGRFHYYEGYTMEQVTFPIRVMKRLGIETLLLSNAAGGINPTFRVGDLMIISDHINLLPNPLVGPNAEQFGERFPDMTRAYDRALIAEVEAIAARLGIAVKKGIYVGVSGPSYETPAEYEYFRRGGADAIGMSTTPEVIVARHAGLRIFAVSVIANEAHHFADDFCNDANDVLRAARHAADTLSRLFTELIRSLP